MEIIRQTPWSRITKQNSVDKGLWEIVGSGKLTGSVLKETMAVSATIWISAQNRHSRILLRDLLRGRVWKMHWEPEVVEAEAQVEECLDYRARITSKELAPIHSVQNGILLNACSTSQKMDADLWKSALMRIARLMNSLAKGLQRMVTKVQWPCWKLHDNWVAYLKIWSRWSLYRFCGSAQTYGNQSDVFDSLKPWYVMVTFETKIHRLGWFAQVILSSVTPMLQILRIGLRKRRNGKSDVPVKKRGSWPKKTKNLKEKYKTAFFSPSENYCLPAPSTLKTRGKIICCRLPSVDAHDQQKGFEFRWIGMTSRCTTTVITANGEVQTHEEATADVKELDIFDNESPRGYASSFIARKALRWTRILTRVDHQSKTHISSKTVFGYSAKERTSFRSWFLVYQRVLPQACFLPHQWLLQSRKLTILRLPQARLPHQPWHLQLCQATVWLGKNGETCVGKIPIQWLCQVNMLKGKNGETCWLSQPKIRKPNENENQDLERRYLYHSDIPEWLQEFREKLVENLVDDEIPEHGDSHASFSHEVSLEPTFMKREDLGKHSVHTHFPKDRNCEICQRTKITRAPCRRRIGGVVPRAENFGDLITADHKVLSEGCESRNNHRYAVVVQDLATK